MATVHSFSVQMDKYWLNLVADTAAEVTPAAAALSQPREGETSLGWSLENSHSFPFGMGQKIVWEGFWVRNVNLELP